MLDKLKYILVTLLLTVLVQTAFAQVPLRRVAPPGTTTTNDTTTRSGRSGASQSIDSVRKRQENKQDSIIYTSKYIKVTNEALLKDSTQVFPLDTGLVNFENYSPLLQPRSPRIHLGNTGLPQRALLFEPAKTIGFDAGLHALDVFMVRPEDVLYYRARVAYTNLSFYSGAFSNSNSEQIFKLLHTQNIKPNWNFTFLFNNAGSRGFYRRQNVSHLNAGIATWYESKGKRYNLLANILFNNLKAPENGSITATNIFEKGSFDNSQEGVRLNNSYLNYRNNGFYLKQFYYIGRIDTLLSATKDVQKILPTQRISHTLYYNVQKYRFIQNEQDINKVFPDYFFNANISQDSLAVVNIRNDFSYSFYLRGKSVSFVKNEVKLDVGLTHDFFHYSQYINDSVDVINNSGLRNQVRRVQGSTYQNIKLNAKFSYRFSDKVGLEGDFQQVVQGYNFGDYLYDAKLNLAGGEKAGRIVLGAYIQNNEPPLIYKNWISNHYVYTNTGIGKQQINNVSFNYINDKLQLDLKAEYFLVNGYQYFAAQTPGGIDAAPAQLNSPLNLLKISVGKKVAFGKWHIEDYLVYQRSDYQTTIRTPEFYNYFNIYYTKLFFNVLNASLGVNARYNTAYTNPSYAVGIGQFYNGSDISFLTYPVITPYVKATLFRTNLFLMYDYANQGLQSNGYYTVNRYPMPAKQLKFGVSWTFYN